jgi:hypothetical protein
MCVDYTAVLAVGKEFDDAGEVVTFLDGRDILDAEDEEALDNEGSSYIREILCGSGDGLTCECLNLYTGYGYYLGYRLDVWDVDAFSASTQTAIDKWKEKFGTEPEIIHTVIVS